MLGTPQLNGCGSKPCTPVNIPIPTKIGSELGGALTVGFAPQPNGHMELVASLSGFYLYANLAVV